MNLFKKNSPALMLRIPKLRKIPTLCIQFSNCLQTQTTKKMYINGLFVENLQKKDCKALFRILHKVLKIMSTTWSQFYLCWMHALNFFFNNIYFVSKLWNFLVKKNYWSLMMKSYVKYEQKKGLKIFSRNEKFINAIIHSIELH